MVKFVLVTTLALVASTFAYVEDRDPVTGDTRCKYRAIGRSENPRGGGTASTFAYVEDRDPVTGDTRFKYRAVGRSENQRGLPL